ncbi:hypothetical protein ACQKFO_21840 [Rossellomorea sp. NPDC071047]|uniref:hypothetical protein n=1 Tax=Rossellomorea sp. NPDC071047 TaxID=3390675 RepID=UPI003CFFF431
MHTKEDLKKILESHQEHLKLPMEWEDYTSKCEDDLPSVSEIISIYSNWKNVLSQFNIPRKNKYSREELSLIINKYREQLISARKWDSFAKQYALPTSDTLIKKLGKWSNIKSQLELPQASPVRETNVYTKQQIIDVLTEHGKEYENPRSWDKYANEHSLPIYQTIRKHLSYEEMKPFINSKRNYSTEELSEIAIRYREYFTTSKKWDAFAKENNLPTSLTYYRRYGSWRKAKGEILH